MGWSMGGVLRCNFRSDHPTFVEKLILVEIGVVEGISNF